MLPYRDPDHVDRPSAPALSAALYAYGLGVAFIVLSIDRQIGPETWVLSGGLMGAVLVHLASPILAIGSSRPILFRQVALWLISLVTAVLTLYARALLLPLLNDEDTYAAMTTILVAVLLLGMLVTQIHLATSTIALLRAVTLALRSLRDFARTAAVSLIGVASAVAVLVSTEPLAWTEPPLSLPATAVGLVVVVGAIVPAARALVRPRPTEETSLSGFDGRPLLLGSLLVASALWAWRADQLFPDGLWGPTLSVESDTAGSADPTLAGDMLRRAEERTGIRAVGERFVVRYGKNIVDDYNSRTRYLGDGRVLVMLNSGMAEDQQRYSLGYQFANHLLRTRLPGIEQVVFDGYAFWAATHPRNPFLPSVSSRVGQKVACGASAERELARGEVYYFPLASVPFVVAEETGGVDSAHALLLEVIERGDDAESVRERVASSCETMLAGYVAPPELVIEAPRDRPDLSDPTVPLAALAEAKARSGLDAFGAQFVVRYTTPPAGLSGDIDASDPARTIIVLSPHMAEDEQRWVLVWYFVGSFVTLHFGEDVEPLRSGFASWASRDRTNPFLVGRYRNFTPQGVCDYLPQADFKRVNTSGATWLSSLPFIFAERSGGADAARRLLIDLFEQGPIDRDEWRERIRSDCARFLGAARLDGPRDLREGPRDRVVEAVAVAARHEETAETALAGPGQRLRRVVDDGRANWVDAAVAQDRAVVLRSEPSKVFTTSDS